MRTTEANSNTTRIQGSRSVTQRTALHDGTCDELVGVQHSSGGANDNKSCSTTRRRQRVSGLAGAVYQELPWIRVDAAGDAGAGQYAKSGDRQDGGRLR